MAGKKKKESIGEYVDIDSLVEWEHNPRINTEAVSKVARSIERFGFASPVIAREEDSMVIAGHTRIAAARSLGLQTVPVRYMKLSRTEAELLAIADNKLGEISDWDEDMLKDILDALPENDLDDIGFSSEELEILLEGVDTELDDQSDIARRKLSDIFTVPPFSVLDTRQGYWMDRKRYWKHLIQDNGESRQGTLAPKGSLVGSYNNGVSILDPVLAEVCVKWFAPLQANCFDCFAGDSVFGYVCDYLGNSFTGIELREEQARLNNQRLQNSKSKYICDDGQNVLEHIEENSQDFLFSCPPYFDLEVYSDLENDASNQKEYADFIQILDNAFSNSIKALKEDRFACIVVGDIRDKKGFYYDFMGDIKRIFKRNNVFLYNELILLEPLGTVPQRAAKYMVHRKVAKCHQNVLIFYKGDPKNIKVNFDIIAGRFEDIIEGEE